MYRPLSGNEGGAGIDLIEVVHDRRRGHTDSTTAAALLAMGHTYPSFAHNYAQPQTQLSHAMVTKLKNSCHTHTQRIIKYVMKIDMKNKLIA